MTHEPNGSNLIGELLDDPEKFDSQGKAYELLQEYFKGKPVDTLRPLLSHKSVFARRSAAFIVSELGADGSSLVADVVPLISDSDLHIQWYALESVMVSSSNGYPNQFINVLRELENSNSSICHLAMRLVSNANNSQIEAGLRLVDELRPNQVAHQKGLSVLANLTEGGSVEVIELLNDTDDLIQKYGAVITKRRLAQSPELIQHEMKSKNEFVSRFAEEAVE